MEDKAIRKFQKEINSGAISLVVLTVLKQLRRPAYGYEISKLLQSKAGELPMNQAAIYPVLRSLEKQNLLESEMIPSDSGPPRRYYQLTPMGQRALLQWTETWRNTSSFVNSLVESSDDRGTDPRKTSRSVSSSPRARD